MKIQFIVLNSRLFIDHQITSGFLGLNELVKFVLVLFIHDAFGQVMQLALLWVGQFQQGSLVSCPKFWSHFGPPRRQHLVSNTGKKFIDFGPKFIDVVASFGQLVEVNGNLVGCANFSIAITDPLLQRDLPSLAGGIVGPEFSFQIDRVIAQLTGSPFVEHDATGAATHAVID